jgi:hypothetical protein
VAVEVVEAVEGEHLLSLPLRKSKGSKPKAKAVEMVEVVEAVEALPQFLPI